MKSIIQAVMMVTVVLLPISARSEIREGTFEAGLFGGYNFFENGQNLKDAPIIGGRFGYNFTDRFGIEGAVEQISTHVDNRALTGGTEGQFRSPMDKVRLNLYYVDAIYHFNEERNFNPFILAGIGGGSYRPTISTVDDMVVINFGVGAKYWVSDNVALRADLRDNMVTENFQETYNNIGVTGGISFAFGGRARPATNPSAVTSRNYFETRQESRPSLMGPAGPIGPAGPAGARGPVGYTGAPGAAMAGLRGAEGPSGARGIRGPTGATGPTGAVARGQAGVAGPSGPAGARGERGLTGAQGASAAGFAGPTGPAGPTGARGDRGWTGARGSTLVGPSGPAGAQGSAGAQGLTGERGYQGSTTAGVAGPMGVTGAVGDQGALGVTGAPGQAGVIEQWMSYRDFWFEIGENGIRPSDAGKVSEIAAYLRQNPSLQIGIDTFMDARDQDLRDRRVNSVWNALIEAGVPAVKIGAGSFGDPQLRRAARVEVLIKTSPNYAYSQN